MDAAKETRTDYLTLIAIAVIAYAAANITHEIVGHCSMALVMGTPCTVVSSFYIPLDVFPATWKYNIIVAAGSTANFTLGIGCLVILRRGRSRSRPARNETTPALTVGLPFSSQPLGSATSSEPSPIEKERTTPGATGYLLWLLMCVNLFLASGYIMAAPLIKFGDSYIMIQNLSGQIFWRPAIVLAGAAALWLSFRAARVELARLVGVAGRRARAIAWKLVVPAYLAGGILWVASASLSPLDWRIAQLEAAGGTFGLMIWLLVLPLFLPKFQRSEREPLVIRRSVGWIAAGALTALFFIGFWGEGIDV